MCTFVEAVSRRLFIGSFQILYIYSADTEDVQRRCSDWKKNWKLSKWSNFENLWGFRLYVHICPGCFSKTIHQIIFRFHILLLHILNKCNVVVLIEKKTNNQNYQHCENIWGLGTFSNQCTFVQAISRKLFIES